MAKTSENLFIAVSNFENRTFLEGSARKFPTSQAPDFPINIVLVSQLGLPKFVQLNGFLGVLLSPTQTYSLNYHTISNNPTGTNIMQMRGCRAKRHSNLTLWSPTYRTLKTRHLTSFNLLRSRLITVENQLVPWNRNGFPNRTKLEIR